MRSYRTTAAIAALAMLISACAGPANVAVDSGAESGTTADQPATSTDDGQGTAADGDAAPPVQAESNVEITGDGFDLLAVETATVGGGTFDGASLRGTHVVLWMWAPW